MTDDVVQGSEEWFALRCGKVTASRVADVIARTKTGWGAGRKNYLAELVAERLTGESAQGFTNAAMQWGTDMEPQARAAYAFYADADVQEVGFVNHPSLADSGASPDGLVGDDGMVEIKCPNTATHIETLLTGKIADKYVVQMLWQMACADRKWCDFVSFDPRMPEDMQIFIQRVERDEKRIGDLTGDVMEFLGEVNDTVANLKAKYRKEAA
jgi:putative phage-type endonuclease